MIHALKRRMSKRQLTDSPLPTAKERPMDIAKLMALIAAKKASMKKYDKTVQVKPGKNRIRLLPGWTKGEEHVWFHDYGQHFVKDVADQLQAVYICVHATFDKPCAVCAALSKAARFAVDDAMADTLSKAKSTRTVLVNALMLDSTEPNTPVILELKRGVFAQILDIIEEWGQDILDPASGKEIVITREGKGLNTKYTAQVSPKSYAVPPVSLTQLANLDEFVKQESEDYQRRAIAAVNGVAGLLPAPGSGGDRPTTTPSTLIGASTAATGEVIDVDGVVSPAVAKGTATAKSQPVTLADLDAIALEADLDALLGELA